MKVAAPRRSRRDMPLLAIIIVALLLRATRHESAAVAVFVTPYDYYCRAFRVVARLRVIYYY